MNGSEKALENFDELSRLLSLVCDGELSGEESARLREILNRSAEARRYFLEYVQLHAELHWATGPGQQVESAAPVLVPECPMGLELPTPWTIRLRRTLRRWRWVLAGAGLLAALSLGVFFFRAVWKPRLGQEETPSGPVAQWGQTSLPQWADGSTKPETYPNLTPGQIVQLQSGFAELVFPPQTRLILEGPARFQTVGPRTAELHQGRAAVSIPPEDPMLCLQTPCLLLQAENTQFGVLVEQAGAGQVHVFSGRMQLRPRQEGLGIVVRAEGKTDPHPQAPGPPKQSFWLEAGQAVRIIPPPEKTTQPIELIEIFPDLPGFVYRLPGESWAGGILSFRAAVAKHPALLHHYTFEALRPEERRRDHRAGLHLVEVIMTGGRGEGEARFMRAPPGADQWAFHPTRGLYAGNTVGSALQSEAVFQPPQEMTVELLVNFAGFPPRQRDPVAALLATRADSRRASFFLAVGAEGHILHLFDADEPWYEADVSLIPGEWYYLASTFQADPQKQTTVLNTYLANLTRRENTLQWVVKNQELIGIPATSRLGIGKGFDQDGSHAYPWAGLLDEIALYCTALDRQTLQQHLELLLGEPRRR